MPTIEQRITDIFVEQTQRTVTAETQFSELEWFDSLDVLETVMALEDLSDVSDLMKLCVANRVVTSA